MTCHPKPFVVLHDSSQDNIISPTVRNPVINFGNTTLRDLSTNLDAAGGQIGCDF